MAVAPLTRRLLSDQVYEHLLSEVLKSEPGTALASERALSDGFGVNRHAVREALKRLQQAGLIEIAQGGATKVCEWRKTAGLDLLVSLATSTQGAEHRELLADIVEMRASVGADVARRCAERTPAAAEEALLARDAMANPYEGYIVFWQVLTDGAKNVAYRLALNTLVAAQRAGAIEPSTYDAEIRDEDAQRHLAAAIGDGDAAGAERLAAELLGRSLAAVRGGAGRPVEDPNRAPDGGAR